MTDRKVVVKRPRAGFGCELPNSLWRDPAMKALRPAELVAWVRCVSYCSEHDTGGVVSADALIAMRLGAREIAGLVLSCLLDRLPDGGVVVYGSHQEPGGGWS